MFAGDIYAPEKIRLIDAPEMTLDRPGEILFQPELACLCGSDLLFFEGTYPEYKIEIGHSLHEMTGTVIETTGERFQPGDRVLCVPVNQRGLFERFAVTELRAIPLDTRVPEEEALLAQPLGTVLYALRKLPNLIDQTVAIVGQGPIGQLFAAAVRNLGAREIVAIDLLESRLQTSPKMGATAVVNASQEDPVEATRRILNGALADVVIEAVGHREQSLNLCTDLCRKFGTILFFGVPRKQVDDLRWGDLFRKNLTVYTSVEPDFTRDFPLAMRWIAERRLSVAPIITHRFGINDIQTAYDTFRQRRDGALKVFLDFPTKK